MWIVNGPIIAWTCWHWLHYVQPTQNSLMEQCNYPAFYLQSIEIKTYRSKCIYILTDEVHESVNRQLRDLLTRWWRRRFSGTRNDVTQTGWRVSSWFTGVKQQITLKFHSFLSIYSSLFITCLLSKLLAKRQTVFLSVV